LLAWLLDNCRRLLGVALLSGGPAETTKRLFKRFKKKVMRSGLLSQLRNKRWFVSKSEVRRIEKKKAIRRINKRKRRDSED
jgi:small subunit ribosomal protein S21